jgi:tRNA(Ile)-lysidine synthase
MNTSVRELSHLVKEFLDHEWNGSSPLLVAYSGGPDSKALLYAALEWGKTSFHVVHVDHGWREESREEQGLLAREIEALGLQFHCTRLAPTRTEEEARTLRYTYFWQLQQRLSCQALLLGHHADDLAETVLKRIFEGAHLHSLTGMRRIAKWAELPLWRPLLSITRATIEDWLQEHRLSALNDRTNQDPRFLRARMRTQLLPFLNKTFGKNIARNLLMLSERSQELREYLHQQNQNRIVRGSFGIWIDGTELPRIELRALIQQEISLPRSVLESILDWIEQKVPRRTLTAARRRLFLDRGHLFFLN